MSLLKKITSFPNKSEVLVSALDTIFLAPNLIYDYVFYFPDIHLNLISVTHNLINFLVIYNHDFNQGLWLVIMGWEIQWSYT